MLAFIRSCWCLWIDSSPSFIQSQVFQLGRNEMRCCESLTPHLAIQLIFPDTLLQCDTHHMAYCDNNSLSRLSNARRTRIYWSSWRHEYSMPLSFRERIQSCCVSGEHSTAVVVIIKLIWVMEMHATGRRTFLLKCPSQLRKFQIYDVNQLSWLFRMVLVTTRWKKN